MSVADLSFQYCEPYLKHNPSVPAIAIHAASILNPALT